jgi:hypothetical protein
MLSDFGCLRRPVFSVSQAPGKGMFVRVSKNRISAPRIETDRRSPAAPFCDASSHARSSRGADCRAPCWTAPSHTLLQLFHWLIVLAGEAPGCAPQYAALIQPERSTTRTLDRVVPPRSKKLVAAESPFRRLATRKVPIAIGSILSPSPSARASETQGAAEHVPRGFATCASVCGYPPKESRCHLSSGRRETARMPRSPWTCSQPVSVGGLAGLRECGNAIHRKQVPFRSSRHQAPLALNTELSMSRHNALRFSRGPHCSLKQMLTRRLQTLVSRSSLEELRVLFTDRVSPGSLTTREPTPIVV